MSDWFKNLITVVDHFIKYRITLYLSPPFTKPLPYKIEEILVIIIFHFFLIFFLEKDLSLLN